MSHQQEPINAKTMPNHLEASDWFDYDSVEWVAREQIEQEVSILDMRLVSHAFRDIMDWVTADGNGTTRGAYTRLNVFMWCVQPQYFNGKSQTHVAKKLGITRAGFSKLVTSFRGRFNFHTSAMRTDETRAKNAANAKGRK